MYYKQDGSVLILYQNQPFQWLWIFSAAIYYLFGIAWVCYYLFAKFSGVMICVTYSTCGRLLLIVAIYFASGDMAMAAHPSGCASNIV